MNFHIHFSKKLKQVKHIICLLICGMLFMYLPSSIEKLVLVFDMLDSFQTFQRGPENGIAFAYEKKFSGLFNSFTLVI